MIYPDKAEAKSTEATKKSVDEITRKVAIVVAFISVFMFFVKLLFF